MPNRFKNYIDTSFFHIMVQGLNKEYIFKNDIDKEKYLKFINSVRKEINIVVIAYCVMSNHVHILLKIDSNEDLSNFMQRVNTLYARYYNKKYNRVGYVYRDRYKSQIIYSESQLYTCINYIHNNPVKANMCNKPDEYKYSSFKNYDKNREFFQKYLNDINNRGIVIENEEVCFLEDNNEREKEIISFINEYLLDNKIKIEDLSNNRDNLKEIVNLLKSKYQISLRKIAEYTNAGRETVRKLVK